MDPGALLALLVVALVLGVFAWQARRRPVLFRMGLRNALRRRGQTAVVVLGLMVGTAIIAGSLASGDSLGFGIRQRAYDGLGPADVLLQLEGQLHFPSVLYDDLAANGTVRREVAALAPLLYEEAALSNPALRQAEPQVSLIGFDPGANRPFGAFRATDGREVDGRELGPRDLYLAEELAQRLGVGKGDPVTVTYAPPPQPRVPRLHVFNGSLTASAGACPLPPLACPYAATPGDPATFTVPVGPGAVSMTTLVAWFGPAAQRVDLDQVLRAPDGGLFANANGTPEAPDNPSFLNVSGGRGGLAQGDWTFEVRAKAAANQPFRAFALVFYEEYNLSALRAFAEQAEAAGFSPEDFAEGAGFGAEARNATFTVREVVTDEGFGDFLFGRNAFARLDAVARMYEVEGKLNLILASGDLDPVKGPAREGVLLDVLPKAVNASADERSDQPAIRAVKAMAIKTRILDAAERAGSVFKEFLTTVGSFTIVAGVMLIVNIFVMLSEERKSELGMARAVGLSRRQLVWLFCFEGLLYALVATFLGVLLGLLLSYGLIEGLNAIFSGREEGAFLVIPFHVEASSLAYAFAAGFLLTLATVAVASLRVARLNVVRAIRRIEEPPRPAGKALFLLGLALLALGLAAAAHGFLRGDFVAKVLGPCLALLGGGLVGARFVPRRIAYPVAGGAVALFCIYSLFTFGNPDGTLNRLMGPARGVLVVISLVLILVHLPGLVRGIGALLLRVRPLVPAVRPGLAYPMGRKTRTGLTITMFALVILVVVAFSVFGATFSIDLRAHGGGYQVEGETTVAVQDLRAHLAAQGGPGADPFQRIARHDELRYALAFGGTMIRIEDQPIEYQGPPADYVYAYDEAFARHNGFAFDALDPAYATAEEAYLAVLRDPGLVIVSIGYNFDDEGIPGRFKPGDTLTMETPGGPLELRIVGFQRQLFLGGIFVHPQVLEGNFQRIRGEYLFEVKPGEDARAVAQDVEAAFQGVGMDAQSVEDLADRQLEQNKRFLTLFQLYLGFGLVVGIASLGIVTARAVLERRQEIGMLRAVGYSKRDVLRMLYVEIFLTTTLGVLVGGVIGLLTAYGVVASTPALSSLGIAFRVPWLDILGILALVYLAVFLTTFLPARRGSRTPPAEAVRYVE